MPDRYAVVAGPGRRRRHRARGGAPSCRASSARTCWPWPTAAAPGRGCWLPRAKSTPWCGSPASPTTTGCSTRTADGARRVLDPPQPVQAADEGRAGRSPLAGRSGLRGDRRRRRGRPAAGEPVGRSGRPWPGLAGVDLLGPAPAVPDGWPVMAARGLRGDPHRGRHPEDGRRAHRQDHPRRNRSHRPDGQLHQRLLHRPGAGRPHRLAGWQRAPPPARLCPRRTGSNPGPTLLDARRQGRRHGDQRRPLAATAAGWRSATCAAASTSPAGLRAGPDGPEVEVRELPG